MGIAEFKIFIILSQKSRFLHLMESMNTSFPQEEKPLSINQSIPWGNNTDGQSIFEKQVAFQFLKLLGDFKKPLEGHELCIFLKEIQSHKNFPVRKV